MKRRLCGEQNWRCAYCGQPLDYESATLDHVLPRHAYGTSAWINLVVACDPCNQRKGGGFKMKWFAEMAEARQQLGIEE
jgi:5-methylcytosine-specific restriction endonuclease McrA